MQGLRQQLWGARFGMLEGESGNGDGLMVVRRLHLENWNETYGTVSLCYKIMN